MGIVMRSTESIRDTNNIEDYMMAKLFTSTINI